MVPVTVAHVASPCGRRYVLRLLNVDTAVTSEFLKGWVPPEQATQANFFTQKEVRRATPAAVVECAPLVPSPPLPSP